MKTAYLLSMATMFVDLTDFYAILSEKVLILMTCVPHTFIIIVTMMFIAHTHTHTQLAMHTLMSDEVNKKECRRNGAIRIAPTFITTLMIIFYHLLF